MLFCLILYSYGSGIYFKLFHKIPYFGFCTNRTYINPFKYKNGIYNRLLLNIL